jgi:outer membrane putative beta-barrel porin/alpha-amylase
LYRQQRKIVRSIAIAAMLVVLRPVYAAAVDDASAPIVTDRPAVTASSIVVPSGSLQAENGLLATSSQGQFTVDGPETLLRLGVASKTELRLVAPDYFGQVGVVSGFGDLAVGMKQQLGPTHGFDVSLILSLSLPTGATAFSSHGYDPSVQLPWSRSLSTNWTAAGMFSVYFPTQEGGHKVTPEVTFLIDRQLTKTIDAFVEYAGDFPHESGPRHLAHIGGSWKLTPHQQVDMHFGLARSATGPVRFIGVGYSFRLQAFRR